LLSTAYKFSRKSTAEKLPTVSLNKKIPHIDKILGLVTAKNQSREWANGRGDV
jgi:hypothetical protein